ncbi:MAG: GNAT family N-acetyltransferase [Chloroflexaceae bacterium]|nr:GNAT family N-acetyltransferase [Chloroflexaceae bacterium]
MISHLFRRHYDLTQAHVRLTTPADIVPISRLLRDADQRYYGLESGDLSYILEHMPGVALEHNSTMLGVVLPGWYRRATTWLRCTALARGVAPAEAMPLLLKPLHMHLYDQQMQHIFYAGDESADTWLIPVLQRYGYSPITQVVVYEKHGLAMPSRGNESITVRPVFHPDLTALLDLDSTCFEPQWTMPASSLRRAINDPALFVVAEDAGRMVGYAYATSHFSGRLIHLVRIAVNPQQRRKGIGVRLLAEVIMYARQQRADVVTLNTQAYNEHAQRLYRWFGFVPNGEQQPVLRYDVAPAPMRVL